MLDGERLKNLRIKRKLTQEQISELAGVSIRQIPRYEASEVDPSGDVIARLADVLEVSTDYLLGRTNDPSPGVFPRDLDQTEQAVIAFLREGKALSAIKLIANQYGS